MGLGGGNGEEGEGLKETEDEAVVCYRINLPEYSAEDVRIRTVHEAATPLEESHDPLRPYHPLNPHRDPAPYNTTGISVVASNKIKGTPQTQTLFFELRLPPQAKKTDLIRAFWREDRRQVTLPFSFGPCMDPWRRRKEGFGGGDHRAEGGEGARLPRPHALLRRPLRQVPPQTGHPPTAPQWIS